MTNDTKLVCPVCGAKIDRRAQDAQRLYEQHVKSHKVEPPE